MLTSCPNNWDESNNSNHQPSTSSNNSNVLRKKCYYQTRNNDGIVSIEDEADGLHQQSTRQSSTWLHKFIHTTKQYFGMKEKSNDDVLALFLLQEYKHHQTHDDYYKNLNNSPNRNKINSTNPNQPNTLNTFHSFYNDDADNQEKLFDENFSNNFNNPNHPNFDDDSGNIDIYPNPSSLSHDESLIKFHDSPSLKLSEIRRKNRQTDSAISIDAILTPPINNDLRSVVDETMKSNKIFSNIKFPSSTISSKSTSKLSSPLNSVSSFPFSTSSSSLATPVTSFHSSSNFQTIQSNNWDGDLCMQINNGSSSFHRSSGNGNLKETPKNFAYHQLDNHHHYQYGKKENENDNLVQTAAFDQQITLSHNQQQQPSQPSQQETNTKKNEKVRNDYDLKNESGKHAQTKQSGGTTRSKSIAAATLLQQIENEMEIMSDGEEKKECCYSCPCRCTFIFDPSGRLTYWWSFVVSLAFVYNLWCMIFRYAFAEINQSTVVIWFILDYFADFLYACDIFINFRTAYLEDGVLQTDASKLKHHYLNQTGFYLDMVCLLPLDFLYLSKGFCSLLRFPRLVKIYKFMSFIDKTERHTNYPNALRFIVMLHYTLVAMHYNTCIYYIVLKQTGLLFKDHTRFTYDVTDKDNTRQYFQTFYWSTVTLALVGDLPRPRIKSEFIFLSFELVFAIFMFAFLLGNIASIVTNLGAAKKEFQGKLDGVKTYMSLRRVPEHLQERVIRWFDYLWVSNKSTDEEKTLSLLPYKLRAEIAIHVHLDTLKKVEIFQNTEAGFLNELVLKLKPQLFSPGDYICRKGEVGKEMYIVNRGKLQVMAENGRTVLATLKAGSYFGEISILNMGSAGNRRTASVKSVGYSDLFCLNKSDLWDVLKEYPSARIKLEAIAIKRLEKHKRPSNDEAIQRSRSIPALNPVNNLMTARAVAANLHATGIVVANTNQNKEVEEDGKDDEKMMNLNQTESTKLLGESDDNTLKTEQSNIVKKEKKREPKRSHHKHRSRRSNENDGSSTSNRKISSKEK
ncbi:hypothetical protein SNEBB_001055 [Seison nebaliae]|nr:hypothetical protein SNEBB_001055 [Seison nebaliae]